MSEQFLDPEILARIDNFSLLARTVVEGFLAGLHRGLYHGFGSEFVQYRDYNRGDDLKYVDWKAYRRLNRLVTKVFQEETSCNCYLVLDASASMAYAGATRPSKLHYGKMIAASLAYLAGKQGDNVGVFGYSEALRAQVRPGHRSGQVQRICQALTTLEAAGECRHPIILNYLAEHFNRRGIIVMISDFLDVDASLFRYLKHFRAAHHEVILFHVLDDDEMDFNLTGTLRLVDSESDQEIVTSPDIVRDGYLERLQGYLEELQKFCRQNHFDYCQCRTSSPLDAVLSAYLHRREEFH